MNGHGNIIRKGEIVQKIDSQEDDYLKNVPCKGNMRLLEAQPVQSKEKVASILLQHEKSTPLIHKRLLGIYQTLRCLDLGLFRTSVSMKADDQVQWRNELLWI